MVAINKLHSSQIRGLPAGKYSDGAGLWLHKSSDTHAGKWILRYTIAGRRREMGLGSVRDVSLSSAREAATKVRHDLQQGNDPIATAHSAKAKAAALDDRLDAVARDTFEARKPNLKNNGKSARWFAPVEQHVLPKLGQMRVQDLDQHIIRQCFEPIWHTKPEIAEKAISRLGMCIKHAAAMDLDVDIQAVPKAKLLLGVQRRTKRHIPSLAWQEVPKFYASLEEPTPTNLALRFLILTATRSAETRLLTWSELEGDIWLIPAERMKGAKSHRIPLPQQALEILETAKQFGHENLPFPSIRGKALSDAGMSRLMERRGMEERPHGFRSSFRNWCAECTDAPREIAEVALAHTFGSKVELAYRRTDYLEQRKVLMQRWADHVSALSKKYA